MKKAWPTYLFCFLELGVCLILSLQTVQKQQHTLAPLDFGVLAAGDVLLVQTHSWRASVVRLFDPSHTDYTHVGILAGDTSDWQVVHATPTLHGNRVNQVVSESLKTFLNPSEVRKVAILTHLGLQKSQQGKLVMVLQDLIQRHIPFDQQFDASTSDALYCTELIGHAFECIGLPLRTVSAPEIWYPASLLQEPELFSKGEFGTQGSPIKKDEMDNYNK